MVVYVNICLLRCNCICEDLFIIAYFGVIVHVKPCLLTLQLSKVHPRMSSVLECQALCSSELHCVLCTTIGQL